MTDEKAKIPKAQPGEKSAKMLQAAHVGGGVKINKELAELRSSLIADIVARGVMGEEEATANVDHFLIGMRKSAQGSEALYATEEGQRLWKEIYKRKTLEEASPPAQPGEKSGRMLSADHVGGGVKINKELAELRSSLIADIVVSGVMGEEEATANVDHFLVGMRKPAQGPEALYATEEGQRLWLEKRDLEISPPVQPGEKSGRMLRREHIGGGIVRQLVRLRKNLIADIVASGMMDKKTAADNVNHFLIGMRKPAQGPEVLYATEEGQRLWKEIYKRKTLEEAYPPAQPGEKSGRMLSVDHVGGNVKINKELAELRSSLIADIVVSGVMGEEEATANVDHFLIGMRKPAQGPEALYATEEGQRLWGEELKRKTPPGR